jgi:hypothetical protein
MNNFLSSLGGVLGLTLVFSNPVQAQMVCDAHANVVKKLGDSYTERQTAMGMARNGQLLEIFVSDDGSWTILLTRPDGVTCVVMAGDYWQDTYEPAKPVRQNL